MTNARIITAVVEDAAATRSSEPTAVPWWSFTKTVMAAAALALVARGRLSLDTPVKGRLFTLRQLLAHRAGLPDYGQLAAYHEAVADHRLPWARALMLQRIGADRLVFEPNQGWAYSNVGYLLVRDLIEEAAGLQLGPALDELVLAPLGVRGVTVAREAADMTATAWGNPSGYHPGWVYHGLLTGPAASAALLLHRLLGGALLPPALLCEMLLRYPVGGPVPGRPWRTAGYGLGLMIGTGETDATYVGHTGGGPGSTSAVYQCVPEIPDAGPRRTVAAFAAVEDPAPVERQVMDLARC